MARLATGKRAVEVRGDLGDGRLDVVREIAARTPAGLRTRPARRGGGVRGEVFANRVEPFAFGGRRGVHRHAGQLPRERLEVDRETARPRLVQHVQIEAERDPELGDLQRQQQRAHEVLRVAHLHERVVRRGDEDVARHRLVLAHRHEVVRAGGVDHLPDLLAEAGAPARDLDRRAWIVADGDVRPGERAEDDALADVRLTDQEGAPAGLRLIRRSRWRQDRRRGWVGDQAEVEIHIRRTRMEQNPPRFKRAPSIHVRRGCRRPARWRSRPRRPSRRSRRARRSPWPSPRRAPAPSRTTGPRPRTSGCR